MKIGMFLDTSFPPDPRVENEATSLINNGHQVFLFSLTRGGSQKNESINDIHVVRYQCSWLLYKLSALVYTFPFYNWLVQPLIKKFLNEFKVDVLHVHDMVIADAVKNVNRSFQLPMVLDLHENRPAIMKYYKHVNSFAGKILINPDQWAKKQQELIVAYDKLIVVTEEAKEVAIAEQPTLCKQDIIVVPNSIRKSLYLDYELKETIIKQFKSDHNLIYVGDTGLRRGVDTVIKAVYLLKDDIKDIHFIIVGKGADDDDLKDLTKSLNVENHVSFQGWQHLMLFPSYMKAAQIGISPIKRNLHHDTTFANKIFQYMAMKLPLLVSDCPPQVNVVKATNCGMVFKADDEQDLADKIRKLFSNADQMKKFGNNGFEAIMNTHHWDAVNEPLLSLYRDIQQEIAI